MCQLFFHLWDYNFLSFHTLPYNPSFSLIYCMHMCIFIYIAKYNLSSLHNVTCVYIFWLTLDSPSVCSFLRKYRLSDPQFASVTCSSLCRFEACGLQGLSTFASPWVSYMFGSHVGETSWVWLLMLLGDTVSHPSLWFTTVLPSLLQYSLSLRYVSVDVYIATVLHFYCLCSKGTHLL